VVRKEYSAGMVKLSFWFLEFRKVIELLNSGKTINEIKDMNIKENIFSKGIKINKLFYEILCYHGLVMRRIM
jgi:hypothetical protein